MRKGVLVLNRGQFYARVLLGAGADYRLGLALCKQKWHRFGRLGADMMIRSSRVLEKPTAVQIAKAVAAQGKR